MQRFSLGLGALVAAAVVAEAHAQMPAPDVLVQQTALGTAGRYVGPNARRVREYAQMVRQRYRWKRSAAFPSVSRGAPYGGFMDSRHTRERALGRPIRSVRERRAAGELDSVRLFPSQSGPYALDTGP